MSRLLTPEMHARLKGLRLTAPVRPRGAMVGQHSGRDQGAGLEFAQYRGYEPGDELRRVDWKLYSRSDRFFVREAERDSVLTVWVLVDASASMAQADAARPSYSKLSAAKIIAACIADIALRQGDSCGLAVLGNGAFTLIPAASGRRHLDRLELAMQQIECRGSWPSVASLEPLWRRVSTDSLVIILSDGFDPLLPIVAERLVATRRQVASLGLVSCEERDFPFVGGFTFREPETGAERRVDAPAERADFRARFARARNELARRLACGGVRHVDCLLDEPVDAPLRRLLHG